jgi:hypothetical protein
MELLMQLRTTLLIRIHLRIIGRSVVCDVLDQGVVL